MNEDNTTDEQPQQENPTQQQDFTNPDGCSMCSCKGYTQDHGNVCTCGHNSEKHTGNNA